MTPVSLGVVLGVVNVVVIAIGMALASGGQAREMVPVAGVVVVFGAPPGVVAGALLGWLAGAMAPLPVWLRRVVLASPALTVVVFLADVLLLHGFMVVSCIPTLAAVFVLEQQTRAASTVPIAHARRA